MASLEDSQLSYKNASIIERLTKKVVPVQVVQFHESSISNLLNSISDLPPDPEVIEDPETVKCLVAYSTDIIVGGCASGLMIIWRNRFRAIHYQYKASINALVHSSVHLVNDKKVPRKVYAGCENGSIIRWLYGSSSPERAVSEFPQKTGPVSAMLLIQDDKILIAGRKDGKIHMWFLTAKRQPFELDEHDCKVTSLQTNQSLKEKDSDLDLKLFSSDLDGNIVIWNIEDISSHHVMHKFKSANGIKRLLVSGEFLISADIKGTLVKWSLDDYSSLCSIDFVSEVNNLCESEDHNYLFCVLQSAVEFSVIVVNVERMEFEKPLSFKAHDRQITDIVVIPGTNKVVTSSMDKKLKVWDFSAKYERSFILNTPKDINTFFISEQTRSIITGDSDGTLAFYELDGRKKSRSLSSARVCPVNCILLTEDSKFIVAGFEDQSIIVWRGSARIESTEFLVKFDGKDGHSEKVNHICTSPDNKLLYSVSSDKTIKVWNLVTRKLEKTIGGTEEERAKSHQNDIIDVKITQNLIVSASDDGFIIVWDRFTYSQLKKFEFSCPVYTLAVSENENAIIAGGKSKTIKVWWDFMTYKSEYDIKGHTDDVIKLQVFGKSNLLYSCSKDQHIKIWSLDQALLLFSLKIPGLKDLHIPSSQSFIFISLKCEETGHDSVHKLKNILFSDEVSVYPPKYGYFFKSYINKIKNKEFKSYDPKWQDYLLFPHAINLAYVFIEGNQDALLKSGISSGLKFLKNKQGNSPLSWALQSKNFQCADVLVKKLSKMNLTQNRVVVEMIEQQMNLLFSSNLSCLPFLFDTLFETLKENVEAAGRLKKKAPMINSSVMKEFDQDYFIDSHSESTRKDFIEFRRSLCRFHIGVGSNESLKMLNSITDCYNSELFKSQMLKALLLYKWRQTFKLLIIETCVYSVSMASLLYYILSNPRSECYLVLIFLILISTFNLLQNLTKGYESFRKFFGSPWNVLDSARIMLTYFYTINQLLYQDPQYIGLELLTLLYCIKAIGYFRIFNKYRYLLRVILEIIKDMIPFFLILFTSTIAFAILLRVSQKDLSFFHSFVDLYMLDQTNFVISLDSFENIFVFFMASLLNPIIMLNLLIAIMGDTYDRIQEDMVVADYREMTELILEAEYFVFWRKFSPGVRAFITRCDYLRNLNLEKNQWMGKIRAVKKSIQSLEGKFKSTSRNIDKVQFMLLEKLKDLSSTSAGLNRRLKDIRNNNKE